MKFMIDDWAAGERGITVIIGPGVKLTPAGKTLPRLLFPTPVEVPPPPQVRSIPSIAVGGFWSTQTLRVEDYLSALVQNVVE
jgi:hypothetical protein